MLVNYRLERLVDMSEIQLMHYKQKTPEETVQFLQDILKNMKDGYETKVKLGEEVAYKLDKF